MAALHLLRLAALAGVLPLLATACSVISPAPTWELVKAAGSAANLALVGRGARASNTVYTPHALPAQVCIEYSPQPPLADWLPALQIELKRHAIDSRVFPPATPVDGCTHWLRYAATTDWETPPMESRPVHQLTHARLSLQRADGRVLSTSEYVAGSGLLSGKWGSTRDKLAPVVTALLTGVEE